MRISNGDPRVPESRFQVTTGDPNSLTKDEPQNQQEAPTRWHPSTK